MPEMACGFKSHRPHHEKTTTRPVPKKGFWCGESQNHSPGRLGGSWPQYDASGISGENFDLRYGF